MKEVEAAVAAGGQDQAESQSNVPQQTPPKKSSDKKKGGKSSLLYKIRGGYGGKKYTFRQGAIAPTWWKVPPVMAIGEVNYPT